jgi:hypothetical protein
MNAPRYKFADRDFTPFYYVHNRGCGNPVHRHTTFQSAVEEATRLAKLTGKNFYVLMAQCKVEVKK